MAALDSRFTTLSTFSKLLTLQVSVQQDTNPLTGGENTGLFSTRAATDVLPRSGTAASFH